MDPQMTMFESLLEAVPDAMVGVDKAGAIRFVNHRTELLFGYEREELVGQPIEILLPESLRQVHLAHRKGYQSHQETREMGSGLALSGRNQDGLEFPVDISLTLVDSEDIFVIAAIRALR